MDCPKCGSTRIHRSRRRGVLEHAALSAISVYPYRCSECGERFRRYHADRRREPARIFRDPPPWLRGLAWTAVLVALGLMLSLAITGLMRKR